MTEPNDQEAAGMARDLVAGMQAMRRGDHDAAALLLYQPGRDGAMLGMTLSFLLVTLEGSGQDIDAWLAARMDDFGDA